MGDVFTSFTSLGYSMPQSMVGSMTAKLENLKDLDLDWWKSFSFFYVTYCIVCVQGRDPLTFLSCPFSFLIGWEFYGPNYLKC